MTLHRRSLLRLATAAPVAATLLASTPVVHAAPPRRIRAIAFDAFPVFDPRPITAVAERLFPGRGAELGQAWRTRQFEYAWLRTLMNRYQDFWRVTEEALVHAARSLKLELSPGGRAQLMQAYLDIKAWPDALPTLRILKEAGLRMAFLSNFTAAMLDAGVRNSGLEGLFEPHLSTDRVGAYKPDPRAYRMAVDAFGLDREQIAFAAFGGWDAVGARSFGFPTFWVNRLQVPLDELGLAPDATGSGLAELPRFVLGPAA